MRQIFDTDRDDRKSSDIQSTRKTQWNLWNLTLTFTRPTIRAGLIASVASAFVRATLGHAFSVVTQIAPVVAAHIETQVLEGGHTCRLESGVRILISCEPRAKLASEYIYTCTCRHVCKWRHFQKTGRDFRKCAKIIRHNFYACRPLERWIGRKVVACNRTFCGQWRTKCLYSVTRIIERKEKFDPIFSLTFQTTWSTIVIVGVMESSLPDTHISCRRMKVCSRCSTRTENHRPLKHRCPGRKLEAFDCKHLKREEKGLAEQNKSRRQMAKCASKNSQVNVKNHPHFSISQRQLNRETDIPKAVSYLWTTYIGNILSSKVHCRRWIKLCLISRTEKALTDHSECPLLPLTWCTPSFLPDVRRRYSAVKHICLLYISCLRHSIAFFHRESIARDRVGFCLNAHLCRMRYFDLASSHNRNFYEIEENSLFEEDTA